MWDSVSEYSSVISNKYMQLIEVKALIDKIVYKDIISSAA